MGDRDQKVGLLADPVFELHDTGPSHPERPSRTERIRKELERRGLAGRCRRIEPVEAGEEDVLRVHDREYLERLRQVCERGDPFIDTPDSAVCPASRRIASLAAGGVLAAAGMIARGEIARAFCAVRPPGHHAERYRSMGFCLLNNIAIAAAWLKEAGGIRPLAVLDWDVHHGNGTQHAFESDPDILFVSLHQHPETIYPGTGFASERGTGAGLGTVLNIPLAPGTGGREYLDLFENSALAAITDFAPEMLLISAGFDAHTDDPLAGLALETETYYKMDVLVFDLAAEICDGRVLTVLEGGYDLDVLADCTSHHVATMLEMP
ncbi:MAG: histone deacetylase [Candidatus Glassbacteria bacterium]|nr:histone deacetylase [Candidatus Glassbacteria bacterium]